MGLKGDRKRAYQKMYMRRHRANRRRESTAFINQRLAALGIQVEDRPPPGPRILSLSDPKVSWEVDHQRYEDWRLSA